MVKPKDQSRDRNISMILCELPTRYWTNWLAAAEFQYNDKKHATTRQTPFELNFGKHPWKGKLVIQMNILGVEDFLIGLQKSQEQTTKAIEEAQKNMKKQFNKKRRNPQGLKVGDNVWLENKNIHSNKPSKKLNNKNMDHSESQRTLDWKHLNQSFQKDG